jgi:PD-(D/E)XK endonuclease
MLTPDQKGSIAEMEIATAAVKLGIGVFKPLSDGHRYDLIFDLGERLARIQCKWAVRRGDVAVINCQSCRRTAEGFKRRRYGIDEIDAIAAYCADVDRCYYLPIARFPHHGRSSCVWQSLATANERRLIGLMISSSKLHWGRLGP